MDLNRYSKLNSKSTYNEHLDILTITDSLKLVYVTCSLYNTTYKFLNTLGLNYATFGRERSLIRSSAELLNPCTGFNLTFEHLLNMIYYLVKEGNFSMSDIERTDYYFADLIYEKLYDDYEQRRKQQEEENRRQEQEMSSYQQMQNYQAQMMNNMNNYIPSGY